MCGYIRPAENSSCRTILLICRSRRPRLHPRPSAFIRGYIFATFRASSQPNSAIRNPKPAIEESFPTKSPNRKKSDTHSATLIVCICIQSSQPTADSQQPTSDLNSVLELIDDRTSKTGFRCNVLRTQHLPREASSFGTTIDSRAQAPRRKACKPCHLRQPPGQSENQNSKIPERSTRFGNLTRNQRPKRIERQDCTIQRASRSGSQASANPQSEIRNPKFLPLSRENCKVSRPRGRGHVFGRRSCGA